MDKLLATIKNNLFLKILAIVNIGWLVSTVVMCFDFLKHGKGTGFEFLWILQIIVSIPFLLVYIVISLLRMGKLDFYDRFFLTLFIFGFIFTITVIAIITYVGIVG